MNNIIKLQPNRVWRTYVGGKMLDQLTSIPNPADTHFPENWIASVTRAVNPGRDELTTEGLSSVIFEGEEITLKKLIEKFPEELLGIDHYQKYGTDTAFLLKFLDSAIRLHLQCHPTISFAKQFLNSSHGKTEGYYILGIRDQVKEPYIYLGFQHPPKLADLKSAIEHQDISLLESYFEKIPVKKGDAFYVPGGLPHAIGAGILMIEIMEPTDFVARIEFEKAGYTLPEKARFMDKGIDFALAMFNLKPITVNTIKADYFIEPKLVFENKDIREYAIFDVSVTHCFRLNKLMVSNEYLLSKSCFFIVIVIGGQGQISCGDEIFDVVFGDQFLIPASTTSIFLNSPEAMELILAMPPL